MYSTRHIPLVFGCTLTQYTALWLAQVPLFLHGSTGAGEEMHWPQRIRTRPGPICERTALTESHVITLYYSYCTYCTVQYIVLRTQQYWTHPPGEQDQYLAAHSLAPGPPFSARTGRKQRMRSTNRGSSRTAQGNRKTRAVREPFSTLLPRNSLTGCGNATVHRPQGFASFNCCPQRAVRCP